MSKSKENETPKPNRRWVRLLFLFGVAVLAAPSLLSVSGKHSAVLKFVNPRLADAIEYQTISSHWWSPLEIRNLEVRDLSVEQSDDSAAAVYLAKIRSVKSVQPLWKLALSRGNNAEFVIDQPVVNLSVKEGQTNVEETLIRIFGESDGSDGSSRMAVTIDDGTIRLLGPAGSSEAGVRQISGIHGRLSTLNAESAFPELALVAEVGALSVDNLANADADRFRRTQIAANLDEIKADYPLQPFDGQLDPLSEPSAEPALKIRLAPSDKAGVQELSIEARRLNCAELQPVIQRFFPDAACMGLVSCRVQAQIIGDQAAEGFAGRIQLLGEDIRWRNSDWVAGESFDIDRLTADGVIALAEDGILVDNLRLQSGVLNLSGDGEVKYQRQDPALTVAMAADNPTDAQQKAIAEATAASHGQVKLNGKIDVAAVTRMLPGTLALVDGVQLNQADVTFSVQVQQSVRQTGGGLDFGLNPEGFQWRLAVQSSPIDAYRDGQRLTLDSKIRLDALGQLDVTHLQLDKAQLSGDFGAVTANPIESGYSIRGNVSPRVLWNDLQQILDVPQPGISGDLQIAAEVRYSPDALRFSNVSLQARGLDMTSNQLTVYSGNVLTEVFDGTFDLQGGSPAIKTLIAPWHSATWLSDQSTVAARLSASAGKRIAVQAVVRSLGNNRSASTEAFTIDAGQLTANLIADSQTGGFLVEKGLVEIPGFAATVTGTLGVREQLMHVNLAADVEYDLGQLSSRVLGAGSNVRLDGRGKERFQISGSPGLWTQSDLAKHRRSIISETEAERSAELFSATGRIAWSGGVLYGVNLGSGQVVAQLANGILRSEPIVCTLGTGDLNVMPQWNLESNLLQIATGGRVRNLDLNPQLTREWLGYVAPVLADAANVDGLVSARVQQFNYYLDNPARSNIDAVLSIHRASASPGNSLGPVLQLLTMLGRNNASTRQLEFPSQDVPIQLVDGMVLHDGLHMDLNGYQLTSSGGVGLDQRVQLVMDVPIEKNGRRIRVPVRGTVTRPIPDTAGILQNLGRQQLQDKVNDKLNDGLKGLFDKL